MQPDNELLRQYATARSEEAFAELVKRHVNLVYSAALRQAGGDAHLAHDVAQNVFTDLARKAASLSHRQTLSGWLYTSAYFAANKMVRAENRRREREIKFMREPAPDNTPETDWENLRPILDTAMHELKESDREAILLRYFENRPYAEVGAKFGLNENAARLRIERALEKLRALLAKRAISTTAGLASVISANAVQVAPTTFAATLTTGSLAAAGAETAFWRFMTSTKFQIGFGALILAGTLTVALQGQAQRSLRLQKQSIAEELAQLKTDNAALFNQIFAASNSQSSLSGQQAELLRLRAEVTRLRMAKNQPVVAPTSATNDMTEDKITEITVKVRFVSVQTAQMPEMEFGWASAGNGASLLSKEQFDGIVKKMQDRSIDLINEGEVTTLSGRQANFEILDAGSANATNVAGTTIDVVPYFSTDSSVFTLDLLVQLFPPSADSSHPVQALQTTNQVHLSPGQTMAIEQDSLPAGWNLDTADSPGPHKLLVFVTPTLGEAIDSKTNGKDINREAAAQKVQ